MIASYKFGKLSAAKVRALLPEAEPAEAMTLAEVYNYDQQQFGEAPVNTIGFQ